MADGSRDVPRSIRLVQTFMDCRVFSCVAVEQRAATVTPAAETICPLRLRSSEAVWS